MNSPLGVHSWAENGPSFMAQPFFHHIRTYRLLLDNKKEDFPEGYFTCATLRSQSRSEVFGLSFVPYSVSYVGRKKKLNSLI